MRNTHINIGTGKELSIKEVATLIQEKIGFDGELAFDASKPDGTLRKLPEMHKEFRAFKKQLEETKNLSFFGKIKKILGL